MTLAIFFLLFILDFVAYYYREISGVWLPPFGVTAYVLTTILLVFHLPRLVRAKVVSASGYVFLGILGAFLCWASLVVFLSPFGDLSDFYLVARYGLYFFLGTQVVQIRDSEMMRFVTLFGYFFIVLLTLTNITQDFTLNFGSTGLNYLRLADSFALLSILTMSYLRNLPWQVASYTMSAVTLFLINSRAALAGFVVAGMLLLLLRNGTARFIALAFLLLAIAISILVLLDVDPLVDNRVFRLFLTPEQDTSLSGRRELFEYGWESIRANWFLGDFKGQLRYGGYGSYIHNGLSYWRQYGLPGFLLVVSLVLGLCWSYLVHWRRLRRGSSPEATSLSMSLSYFAYTVALVVFAKSHVYVLFFFSLGMSFKALLSPYRRLYL